MSEHTEERWEARQEHVMAIPATQDLQWIVAIQDAPFAGICVIVQGYDEARAKRISQDHNACLGIEDSATTVPELVEALRDAERAECGWIVRARAVLAKTGKP